MTRRPGRLAGLLSAAALLAVLGAVCAGSVALPPLGVARALVARLGLGESPLVPAHDAILWMIRVPRVLIAATVGGGLAVVGAALQSVFRNPLADAGLLGVGAGAALGAVAAVSFASMAAAPFTLPLFAFAGAMAAVLLVYLLSHAAGRPSLHGLVLTGVAVSALAGAGTSVLLVATEEHRAKAVLFWLAGGLEGRGWEHLLATAPPVFGGCLLLVLVSRVLDALSLGDEEAAALGVRVHAARMGLLGLCALVAGSATAAAGAVPFVGLVAPHALRPLFGGRAVRLLPAAFLGGAILVVLADAFARSLSQRMDLPLGSLTALVGAPYFLFALRGSREREA